MNSPNLPPYTQGQHPWGPPPAEQPGWSPGPGPAPRGNPVLPVLALAVAVIALVASVLPYYRSYVTSETALEYTGWQQRFVGPDLGGDSFFLGHSFALVLACGVLVAGAVLLFTGHARAVAAALVATGAGMVVAYAVFVLADLVSAAAQEANPVSARAGAWLLALAGLAAVAVLVLALRAVAVSSRVTR